jgi:FixJ family two-component response regulator
MKIYQWNGWRYDAKTAPEDNIPEGWFKSKADAAPKPEKKPKPETKPQSGELTEDQVLDIVTSGLTAKALAEQYGITPQKVGVLRRSAK